MDYYETCLLEKDFDIYITEHYARNREVLSLIRNGGRSFIINEKTGSILDICDICLIPNMQVPFDLCQLILISKDEIMNNFKKILVHDRQHALAWMDIQIGDAACPRIIFELFTDICPKVRVACINNLNLCVSDV